MVEAGKYIEEPTDRNAERYNPKTIASIQVREFERIATRLGEMDRVLGGGLVRGHVVLFAGDPGAGKTSLALQMLHSCDSARGLFISAELTENAVGVYAKRLGTYSSRIEFVATEDTDDIDKIVKASTAQVIVVDSLSKLATAGLNGQSGNPNQVKYAMDELIRVARERQRALVVISHVNNDGEIAGPRRIQHGAHVTLMFLKRKNNMRTVKSIKSQQGPSDEKCWFRRTETGALEPSGPPVQIADHAFPYRTKRRRTVDHSPGHERKATP
jgi:DNA repair protein RadA/Sms